MTTQTQVAAPKAEAPKAKPTVALAAISPETASNAANGMVKAATVREKADGTFLENVCKAARLIGVPLSAAQYDKQVAPSVRAAFAKGAAAKLADTTKASYRSRFKTLVLALNCGDASLQPKAGEAYLAYMARAADGVAKAKLPDGSPVWEPTTVKTGRAAGTKAPKAAPPVGGQTSTGLSKGETDHTEGGMNTRPKLAAALILCDQNMSRAQRLARAVEAFPAELDKWLSSILSDDDKATLNAQTRKGQAKAAANG